ncbi:MAG TPA: hypothetical protein DCM27_05530 [Rhodospirillaceae bacterium]|nr:hypothetical protein [Rhodospirillaceae bacterium]
MIFLYHEYLASHQPASLLKSSDKFFPYDDGTNFHFGDLLRERLNKHDERKQIMPNNPNQQNQVKPDDKAREQRPQTQEEKDRAAKSRTENAKPGSQKSGNY